MDRIEVGCAATALQFGNDGIVAASFSGLVLPSNLAALAVPVMRIGAARGARALLYTGARAALCFDAAVATAMYPTLEPGLRALPVAFVVNSSQAQLYRQVVQRAGAAGLLRGVFYSEFEAREWLARNLRLLAANQAWWALRG